MRAHTTVAHRRSSLAVTSGDARALVVPVMRRLGAGDGQVLRRWRAGLDTQTHRGEQRNAQKHKL